MPDSLQDAIDCLVGVTTATTALVGEVVVSKQVLDTAVATVNSVGTQVAADRAQTGLDRTQTGADRAATALDRTNVVASRDAVTSLAGVSATFLTKAEADAALGSIATNAYVLVLADEAKGSLPSIYQKVASAFTFRLNLARPAAFDGADVSVTLVGDSINKGNTPPNVTDPGQQLKIVEPTLSRATLFNDAIPGSGLDTRLKGGSLQAADMVARYATNIYPRRPAVTGVSRAYLLICMGANDYQSQTMSPAAWADAYDAYCQQAQADGFTVIAYTIMRRSDNAAVNDTVKANEKRAIMNDRIRRSPYIANYVDMAVLLTNNATQTIEGTHPNDPFQTVMARAIATAIKEAGQATPNALVLPAATLKPRLGKAEIASLERAAITRTSSAGVHPIFVNDVPALGTGDFSVSWWHYYETTDTNNMQVLQALAGATACNFGLLKNADQYGQLIVQPGTAWSRNVTFPGVWNHLAITRVAGVVSHYVNGALVASEATALTADLPALRYMMVTGTMKVARPRVRTRAMSLTEVVAEYECLSTFDATETAYSFALDDGCNAAGYYVEDLGPNKCTLRFQVPASQKARSPGRFGLVHAKTTGSVVFSGMPIGARIIRWTVKITAAGTALDIGDANGNGRFYASAGGLAVGTRDLPLASAFPTSSDQVYLNGAGYTIEHLISWER